MLIVSLGIKRCGDKGNPTEADSTPIRVARHPCVHPPGNGLQFGCQRSVMVAIDVSPWAEPDAPLAGQVRCRPPSFDQGTSVIFRLLIHALFSVFCIAACFAEAPVDVEPNLQILQSGVRLTLVVEHPGIVTPTGIDIDKAGKIWAVASHTHFRPQDYDGPEHDEIVVFSTDRLPVGEEQRHVFYNKTDATMDLELGADDWVYLAERDRILRVRDTDGDGRGDQEETLAELETEADYPHNGLSGLAWHPSGDLIFSLGENYWTPWTLTGPDGRAVQGTGEGGVFRCNADGTSLRRIAHGFWNPFGICVRKDGTIFAAENDPGARPPCRLLHVVEGGDYGYQRLYGNAPFHPFVCWNGELPGTLPMLHSLGEAPCGIAPLGNGLIVPSWTDHRIDFYPLTASGASFTTERITLIRGGDHFRPTAIAQQSPTVFFLTDWVYGSYELHGRGRIWKLEIDAATADWIGKLDIPLANQEAETAAELRADGESFSDQQLFELARGEDPFLSLAALDALSRRTETFSSASAGKLDPQDQISLLLAIRKANPQNATWARYFLGRKDAGIRFEALRWIADEGLAEFSTDIEMMLRDDKIEYTIYEACLAAWNTLAGNPRAGIADPEMLISTITNTDAAPSTRAYALRLLDANHRKFSPKLWQELYETNHPRLISELTRALAAKGTPQAKKFLMQIADNGELDPATRGDAISGLSGARGAELEKLIAFAASPDRTIREESLRSLRFAELNEAQRERLAQIATSFPQSSDLVEAAIDAESVKRTRPQVENVLSWQERLAAIEQPVDVAAGRRIFHHASVGTCVKCHRHSGRGSAVGPDLSAASNLGDSDRLLRAILQPSREVDPQYFPRMLVTEDGHVFTGIMLRDGGGGKEFYRDNAGRERMFKTAEIVQRKELSTSMMPDGLIDLMTDREIRDLIAFMDTSGGKTKTELGRSEAQPFLGTWWLDFPDGYGGWLSVENVDGELSAKLLWRVGSVQRVSSSIEGDKLVMLRKRKNASLRFIASTSDEEITVRLDMTDQTAKGRRCPPMPPRPTIKEIRFGDPIELFNGRDLTGWQLQPPTAINGWRVQDGVLVNETPKQDFTAYGTYGNLRTKEVFGDCQLHVEFNVGQHRNSGIYVRGLYEAQVVDRDSPMQGINGPGAIFGRIAPSKNAGREGGTWQTYDITLVDRHLTVELNGQRVIDNQPVEGCTGGELFGEVTRDGPVYLQGDHTSVRYRNLRLRPRIE